MKPPIHKGHIYFDQEYRRFYDLELGDFLEDLAFYERHVPEDGQRILELGCGTGRLGLALARAGYDVTGIDISRVMLRAAVEKSKQMKSPANMHFICMDMTEMALRMRFDAIVVAYNTLNMLTDLTLVRRCLDLSRQHLNKGGRLMIDVFTPDDRLTSQRGKRMLQFKTLQCSNGDKVHMEIAKGYNCEKRLLDTEVTYWVTGKGEKKAQEAWQYRCQVMGLSQEDWEKMLTESGFSIQAVYKDYSLAPYVAGQSSKMLLVAES